ncbi:MAG: 50S ribosomal protein L6 [Alphaproteobacteria bacterium GM202ARS2]|nr:50S ribosomal protein L6 [Alphaproteobacteria bacterium GM202ARS2]
MSRIGKTPIMLPDTTKVDLQNKTLKVSDKGGEMQFTVPDGLSIEHKDKQIIIQPQDSSRQTRTLWGTARSRIANMVKGVSEGFQITLLIEGVGYRAQVKGNDIVLQLGYSHEVVYGLPEGIQAKCPQPTQIVMQGHDCQKLGQVAAEIRAFRPPEPYKGKGVRLQDEVILRKEGKKKK